MNPLKNYVQSTSTVVAVCSSHWAVSLCGK